MKTKLPEGWEEKKLEEVANVDSGQGAPQGDKWFSGENIFVRAGDLNKLSEGKFVGDFCEKISSEAIKEYSLKKYKSNSIVFPKSGMSIKTDNIALLKHDCYVVNHLAIIEPKNLIDAKYIYYALKKLKISNLSKNSSYPSIRISDVKNFKLLWPKSELREKIVSILEKAENAKELRKEADELSKDYLKSVFVDMFGDPRSNSKKWKTKKGKEFIELAYGKGLSKKDRDGGKYPVFGSNGVVGGHSKYLVKGPGIVVGRKGSIGKLNFSEDNFWPIDTTYYIITNSNLKFIHYMLQFFNLERLNKSAAVPGLNRNDVYNLDIIDAPIELQNKFASIVKQVESMKEHQKESKQELDNLFNALMQKAFKGELKC
jgi:type I restriction enzyme, S subunit